LPRIFAIAIIYL